MRQWGLVFATYANQQRDWLPRYTYGQTASDPMIAGREWFRAYYPYILSTSVGRNPVDVADAVGVLDCPTTRHRAFVVGGQRGAGNEDEPGGWGATIVRNFDFGMFETLAPAYRASQGNQRSNDRAKRLSRLAASVPVITEINDYDVNLSRPNGVYSSNYSVGGQTIKLAQPRIVGGDILGTPLELPLASGGGKSPGTYHSGKANTLFVDGHVEPVDYR